MELRIEDRVERERETEEEIGDRRKRKEQEDREEGGERQWLDMVRSWLGHFLGHV